MWENPGNIKTLLGFSLLVGYLLLLWFRTNVFVEYVTLFRLTRFFHVGEYRELVDNGYSESYISFLLEYYKDLFIVRLVACPICLGFWLALPSAMLAPEYLAVIPLGLFFYALFNKLI
jgi:hypothetical protein